MESYERAWAEALAQEHAHQQELLATLRDELGTFAGECAAALTALDAVVGLAGVGALLDTAKTSLREATLVRDVGRRLAGPERAEQTDRELLQRVAGAPEARAQLEQIIGPAPVAALSAIAPLARSVPALRARGSKGGGRELVASARENLSQVLQSTAALTGETIAADAVALADSLRDTVEHVEQAARAVLDGKLEAALAEARRRLEADLDELRAVHERAEGAPTEWRSARRTEHTALTEEVREKLDKVEKLRRVLGLLLPHLQLTARALATVEKLRSLEGRLDPPAAAGLEAARLSVLLAAAELWDASLPEQGRGSPAHPAIRKRWFAVAALVLASAVIGIALGLSGGSGKKQAVTTLPVSHLSSVTATVPAAPAPKVSPVNAVFEAAQRATFYAISARASGQGTPRYSWHLSPPKNDPTCARFGSVPGSPNRAVWHHADTDGCNHAVMGPAGHLGTVTVTVTTRAWECTASFFGTNTQTGSKPPACRRL